MLMFLVPGRGLCHILPVIIVDKERMKHSGDNGIFCVVYMVTFEYCTPSGT